MLGTLSSGQSDFHSLALSRLLHDLPVTPRVKNVLFAVVWFVIGHLSCARHAPRARHCGEIGNSPTTERCLGIRWNGSLRTQTLRAGTPRLENRPRVNREGKWGCRRYQETRVK